MAYVYSDHCMRLVSRKFFSQDACVVIGHILALRDCDGIRTVSEKYLVEKCAFNEHRVRRVLGAYGRHGLITKLDPPRECKVGLKLALPGRTEGRYHTFTKTNAVLTIQQGQLITTRVGKLKQEWSMDTRENMNVLERKFRKMDAIQRNGSRKTFSCECGKVSEETLTMNEFGEMACFFCCSRVEEHSGECIALWELDVYEAMEYALRYRYPSLKYTQALNTTVPVPARFQPVVEADEWEDEWEDMQPQANGEEVESEDVFVNVLGVPRAICDITEEDQQTMTDEEFSAFRELLYGDC